MRFAFKTANHLTSWGEILDVWKEADRIELFESGWLFDHFYPIGSGGDREPDPSEPCLEGWSMLAALAQATSRLRLGTLVTGIHYRHPAVLANMAATIDIISGGRLEIGIGAGWNKQESGAYGIELGGPRERSDRFEEACQVLIGLLSQPTTDFQGTYYRLTDARCEPKAIQRPHPPLTIGGSGEQRTLRTVARYAQHWNFVAGTPEEFARKRDVLHGHCQDVGRDTAEIMLSAHVWLHSDQEIGRTVDEVAAFADVGLDMAIIYLRPPLNPAVLTPLAEALAPLR
ncbi:LLM class F420-dependent oxidoreductase [Saccharopolyspora sp. K220]|uniref:LLM class F420-dependent oxidoreductase n=1 Tax=Saccharopolyspora soli TaxID=2926618 RepID=UPI001F5A345A|nr:LLM class F420-dependent oxidoreductase [Saccharopolyspora soli]MCI2416567.1 LLM class F420-dependent oxidoreductase [Saccharopolyspora soli]